MNGSESEVQRRMLVFGRVQMVLFRDSARRRAKTLGLKGYVQNLKDGSVEIVAKGPLKKVDDLFSWAKRGPIFARVDRYEINSTASIEDFDDFIIKY